MNWQNRMDRVVAAFQQAAPPKRAAIRIGDERYDVLVADTPARWAQGLVGQQLDGLDGMLFAMPAGTTFAFHIRTLTEPVTILYFDQDGRLLDRGELSPQCPEHRCRQPYAYAVELVDRSRVPSPHLDARSLGLTL